MKDGITRNILINIEMKSKNVDKSKKIDQNKLKNRKTNINKK